MATHPRDGYTRLDGTLVRPTTVRTQGSSQGRTEEQSERLRAQAIAMNLSDEPDGVGDGGTEAPLRSGPTPEAAPHGSESSGVPEPARAEDEGRRPPRRFSTLLSEVTIETTSAASSASPGDDDARAEGYEPANDMRSTTDVLAACCRVIDRHGVDATDPQLDQGDEQGAGSVFTDLTGAPSSLVGHILAELGIERPAWGTPENRHSVGSLFWSFPAFYSDRGVLNVPVTHSAQTLLMGLEIGARDYGRTWGWAYESQTGTKPK